MKVVILAGGIGTKLSQSSNEVWGEDDGLSPKPMININGKPILWHVMKIYSSYGFNDFVILCGHKSYIIKEYFTNYYLRNNDISIDLSTNSFKIHTKRAEPWKITLLETGTDSMTGYRVLQAKEHVEETFLLTYGDRLADINISHLLDFHLRHKRILTITAIQPTGRYGALNLEGNKVRGFMEKSRGDGAWINGGFFVCNRRIFNFLEDDRNCVFEENPLRSLVKVGEIEAFRHDGFWRSLNTQRDQIELEEMAKGGQIRAPWVKWEE